MLKVTINKYISTITTRYINTTISNEILILKVIITNTTNQPIKVSNIDLISVFKYFPFLFGKKEIINTQPISIKPNGSELLILERPKDKKNRKYKVIINKKYGS